jgi:phenylalanyl-tRNA synthetase beta chain
MKVSWNWLRELVPVEAALDDVVKRLTLSGLEIEGITELGRSFSGVVVAEVKDKRPHPKSAKLTIVTVSDGQGTHEVVCGAPNVPAAGGRVLWARPGARLPDGRELGKKEIAGVVSPGMLCSQVELGLGEGASGIIVLEGEDASAAPGASAQDALALVDTVLEVNVTPNRGDALGHLGVAREVAALFGVRVRPPDVALDAFTSERETSQICSVEILDAEGCPRYTARVIDGLKVGPSPRWMRRRLEAVGVRPISNLVDVTNYVMFELGQPLHAFDYERVAEARIVVRRAAAGETLKTLDDQERKLEPSDLLICDGKGPVALAGVMGGAGSEVSRETSRVLLESAFFQPATVRKTARRLALHSESSHRFERRVDPNGADAASARAARLLCEIAGGRVARGLVDVYPKRFTAVTLELRAARARAVLGMDVATDAMARYLTALELGVEPRGETLQVSVPTFRADLEREVDLIEEVGRLHGYDTMPATLPPQSAAPSGSGDPLAERVRDALCAAGFDEAITFGFTSQPRLHALRFPNGHPAHAARALIVKNPLREDLALMRTSLLPNLLAALQRNLAFGVENVRIFEVGHVFLPSGQQLPDEPRFVAGVLCGDRSGWLKSDGPIDFYDARGLVERLFAALRLEAVFSQARNEEGFLHPGVAASVTSAGEHVGVVGEVHPETRDRLGIEQRCFAFELNLERLPRVAAAEFRPLPRHPAVVRDVSFFVDDFVPAARIREVVLTDRPPILEELKVLDDYREPGKVPPGKKGMLWSITYRAEGRTLTDDEVDRTHEAIVDRLLRTIEADRR